MTLFNCNPSKMAKTFMLAVLAAALFAPSAASAKDDLRIGMSQYPSILHPLFDDMVARSLVLGTALRPVTAYDASWKLTCMLCTELPTYDNGRARKVTLENGKTGIAADYTLKDDLFWADGAPLTTKDILFTWKAGKHPQTGASNSTFFATDIANITARDDKNFTITFSKEMCEFAGLGDFVPLPAHLEEAIFDADPAHYRERTLYVSAPQTAGLYMGPYRVEKAEAGAQITMMPNAYWKGPKPAFTSITFRAIENSAALSANLLSGGIDYIAGELGLSLDQALALEPRLKKDAFDVTYKPGLTYEHIDLNLDVQALSDVRLRRAMMYAMDRDAVNVQLFKGKQPVAHTNINPLDTIYTADVDTYPHDPERAAALLDEAGWTLGNDGYRYKDGQKLDVTLATTAGNKSREMILQAIQSDWKRAGIASTIKNEPARVLFGDTMRLRSFTGGVMYAWMSAPKNIPRSTIHSSMIPSAENSYAGQNYPGYANADMDKTIDDLEVVCEAQKNTQLWHDLQKRYAQDLPALPLYYRADAFFVPKWLTGMTPTGHLNPSTLWIENWSAQP